MSENAPSIGGGQDSQDPTTGDVNFTPPPAPTRAQLDARRNFRRALKRAQNPLYIPVRWLLLMLAMVFLLLIVAAALVISLRSATSVPALESVIEIVTVKANQPVSQTEGETNSEVDVPAESSPKVILAPATPASIVLTGPAVPTVIITNTPVPLAVGLQSAVYNVGNDELNVRNIPSLRGSEVLFRAPAGTLVNIIGGPQEADGFTWWQLHDPQFEVIGWAVAIYLQTASGNSG